MAGGHYAAQNAPARMWVAVTPSDDDNLPAGCRGLYIGTTGNLSLVGADGVAVVFATVPVGYLKVGPVRVNATGTTAGNIVALY